MKTRAKPKAPGDDTPTAETPKGDTPKPRFGKDQPAHYCGKKGRSGPPKGSQNAIRHGLKAGQLPKDCKYLEYRLNAFRRTIEALVMEAKGQVSLTDAGLIQTCLRWERHAALAQRWLTKKSAELKPADLLQFSREIARASTERDKALAALHLDRDAKDSAIEALYALPSPKANGDTDEPA